MATMGAISHDQFPSDICVRHVLAGENVGFDYGDPTAAVLDLHRLMMAEGPCPRKRCTAAQAETHGHYLNLTNPSFKRVGIGIVLKGEYLWLTENFTS